MKTPEKLILPSGQRVALSDQLLHLTLKQEIDDKKLAELLEGTGFKPFPTFVDEANKEESKEAPSEKREENRDRENIEKGNRDRSNRSSYALFLSKWPGYIIIEDDIMMMYERLQDFVDTISPVYYSKKENWSTYLALKADTLVLELDAVDEQKELRSVAKKFGLTVDETRSRYLNQKFVVKAAGKEKGANVIGLAGRLQRYGAIKEVYFEQIPLLSPLCSVPNDPLFVDSWHLPQIGWSPEIVGCNSSTVISVIDLGVDLKHPDLSFASPGLRLNTMQPDGSPTGNHGTPCAGIAAAMVNNLGGAGVAGMAKVLPLAVTTWSDLEIANGINYSASFGADVISMSFGVYDSWNYWNYDLIDPEIIFADNQGTFMCAATGNENSPYMRYPAKHPLVMAVGGSNRDDMRKARNDNSAEPFWGASYGEEIYKGSPTAINVVAPCLEIPATDRLGNPGYSPDDYTLRFNGTSSATPIVAGLAGLIKSRYPFAGNSTVKRIIEQSADKIGPYTYVYRPEFPNSSWTSEVGHGRVNVRKALKLAKEVMGGNGDDCCCDHGSGAKLHMVQTPRNGGTHKTVSRYDNNNDACFEPIKGLELNLHPQRGSQLLLTLSASDTWNTVNGDGSWFAIEVNGKVVCRGLYTGDSSQRMPISLNTVVTAHTNNAMNIRAKWCTWHKGTSNIGSWSETTLTALVIS